ncbi:MAG: GWxTD domain-containing protein [candidate division Zixibacteria bacterium]|nr:GWxTD domain-containing protein [candidate division Zixibacteria bacterium]
MLGLNRHKLSKIGVGVVMLFAGIAHGEAANEGLSLYAGVSTYANPAYDSVTYVEFCFSLNRNELEFYRPNPGDSTLYSKVFAQVDIVDRDGLAIDSAVTYFSARVPSQEEAQEADIRLFNRLALFVKPGVYSARVTVIDAVSKRKGEHFFDRVEVPTPVKDSLSTGDFDLAYEITRVREGERGPNPRLVKNGLCVISNPNKVFTEDDSVAFIYGEVYNLAAAGDTPVDFAMSFSVLDQTGAIFRSLGRKNVARPGRSSVIVESFDIRDWPEGQYYLRSVVDDPLSGQTDSSRTPFRVISKEKFLMAASLMVENDPYDTLDLQTQMNLVEYLLTAQEKETLSRLTETGQKNFLEQYWKEHDINRSTAVIENRILLMERYRYANQLFSTDENNSNGWRSDRGRVYMSYGPWDEREEVSSPRVGNPFEIWHYRLLKEGKYFVFEDWSGTLEYRLVHSNVFGEVYDKVWEERINQELLEIY